MALDADPTWLGLVLEHTRSWCKPKMLLGSLVEKNRVEASVGLGILGELEVLFLDEEHVVQR